MSMLERAMEVALKAHAGRTGEDGEPEILHPLRVMLRLHGDRERQAALLHDVIEDCGWSEPDLVAAGFDAGVVAAVAVLTGRPGESYDDYIGRVALDPLATRVKRADVEEHFAVLCRLPSGAEQPARLAAYLRARATLASAAG